MRFIIIVCLFSRTFTRNFKGRDFERSDNDRSFVDYSSSPEVQNAAWMAEIENEVLLSELTIPGTHDTLAMYGGRYSQCQSWTLEKQYLAGIRFVDIRLGHFNHVLLVHHGPVYQFTNFDRVLNVSFEYLRTHPTECVIMRIKNEFTYTGNKMAFQDVVQKYLDVYPQDGYWTRSGIPALQDVRGKIVIVQNFPGIPIGIPFGWINLEDSYKMHSTYYLGGKYNLVSEHLVAASRGRSREMYLTFSSATGIEAWPSRTAKEINKKLWNLFSTWEGRRMRIGILAMDFPGAKIIRRIVNLNTGKN